MSLKRCLRRDSDKPSFLARAKSWACASNELRSLRCASTSATALQVQGRPGRPSQNCRSSQWLQRARTLFRERSAHRAIGAKCERGGSAGSQDASFNGHRPARSFGQDARSQPRCCLMRRTPTLGRPHVRIEALGSGIGAEGSPAVGEHRRPVLGPGRAMLARCRAVLQIVAACRNLARSALSSQDPASSKERNPRHTVARVR